MNKNILKQWQAEHKKQQRRKKHQFGWFTTLNPNVGNNEYNNAVFNNVMGSGDTDAIVNAATNTGDSGMGESISKQQNALEENHCIADDLKQTLFEFGPYTFKYEDGSEIKDYYYDVDGFQISDAIIDLHEHKKIKNSFLDKVLQGREGEVSVEQIDEYFLNHLDELYSDDNVYNELVRYFNSAAKDAAYEYIHSNEVLEEGYSDSRYTELYYNSIPINASYTSGYANSYGDEDVTDIDDTIEFVYKADNNSVIQALSDILDEEIPDTYGELDDKERFEFLKDNWEELVDRYQENLKKYFYTEAQEAAIDSYFDRYIDESMESNKLDIKGQIKYFQQILKQDKEALEFAKANNFDDIIQASIERRIKAGEDTLNQLYKDSGYDEQSLNDERDITDLHNASLAAYRKLKQYKKGTKEYQDAYEKWYSLHKELTKQMYKGNSYVRVGSDEISVQDFPTTIRIEESCNEGKVNDLMIEVEDAGGIETWMIEIEERYDELIHELKYLKYQAPKEIKSGGSFDSQYEIDEAIKEVELDLADLENKYRIVVGADL